MHIGIRAGMTLIGSRGLTSKTPCVQNSDEANILRIGVTYAKRTGRQILSSKNVDKEHLVIFIRSEPREAFVSALSPVFSSHVYVNRFESWALSRVAPRKELAFTPVRECCLVPLYNFDIVQFQHTRFMFAWKGYTELPHSRMQHLAPKPLY